MKILNEDLNEFEYRLKTTKKRIILYGAGDFAKRIINAFRLHGVNISVDYIIDNGRTESEIDIFNNRVRLFRSDKLNNETNALIIISSTTYAKEIMDDLLGKSLDDSIDICIGTVMLAKTIGKHDKSIMDLVEEKSKAPVIPKVIHSFWFSGEKKPKEYQECIDSWKRFCPDYEIIEYNLSNYDYSKNKFMLEAVKKKKWAFATDYARLDVVYNQGGIYMDMDVEILKSFDLLLGVNGFAGFGNAFYMGFETFGAKKGNKLLKKCLDFYEGVEFDKNKIQMYVQPLLMSKTLTEYGVNMTGDMQLLSDGNLILPRDFFCPMDCWMYRMYGMSGNTIAIHRDNLGWGFKGERAERLKRNRELEMLSKTEGM